MISTLLPHMTSLRSISWNLSWNWDRVVFTMLGFALSQCCMENSRQNAFQEFSFESYCLTSSAKIWSKSNIIKSCLLLHLQYFPWQDKLPRNAVILVMPQIPQLDKQLVSVKPRRFKQWNTQLSSMAKVIHAPCHSSMTPTDRWSCFDSMVMAVRMTIAEVRLSMMSYPSVKLQQLYGILFFTDCWSDTRETNRFGWLEFRSSACYLRMTLSVDTYSISEGPTSLVLVWHIIGGSIREGGCCHCPWLPIARY